MSTHVLPMTVYAVVGSDYESHDVLRLYATEAHATAVADRYRRWVDCQRAKYDAAEAGRAELFELYYEQLRDMGFTNDGPTGAGQLALMLTDGEDSPYSNPYVSPPRWRWISVQPYTIHPR